MFRSTSRNPASLAARTCSYRVSVQSAHLQEDPYEWITTRGPSFGARQEGECSPPVRRPWSETERSAKGHMSPGKDSILRATQSLFSTRYRSFELFSRLFHIQALLILQQWQNGFHPVDVSAVALTFPDIGGEVLGADECFGRAFFVRPASDILFRPSEFNARWKLRTELRCGNFASAWSEESNRVEAVAHPHFARASVEIEGPLLGDLSIGIAWGKDFHTDFRTAGEAIAIPQFSVTFGGGPGYIRCFDAVGGGDGAFT